MDFFALALYPIAMSRPNPLLMDTKDSPPREFPITVLRRVKDFSGHISEKHWHGELQLIWVTTGEASVHCHSGTIRVGAGQTAILNPFELHYIDNFGPTLSFFVIRVDLGFFRGERADEVQTRYLSALAENEFCFVSLIQDDIDFQMSLSALVAEFETRASGWELAVKARAFDLLCQLFRKYRDGAGKGNSAARAVADMRRLKAVFDYIDRNYSSDIDLGRLASQADLSPSYFCRLFKKISGMSSTEYVNRLRVCKACSLMARRNSSLTEVAFACGFNDAAYFSRVFKSIQGVAPSEYLARGAQD
jgi:AraC-like DNA-binding protein